MKRKEFDRKYFSAREVAGGWVIKKKSSGACFAIHGVKKLEDLIETLLDIHEEQPREMYGERIQEQLR